MGHWHLEMGHWHFGGFSSVWTLWNGNEWKYKNTLLLQSYFSGTGVRDILYIDVERRKKK